MTSYQVEQLSFIPTSNAGLPGTVPVYLSNAIKRPLADWAGDIVNAMNFAGVDPTGATDSTAGLQAAINTAFGVNGTGSTIPLGPSKALFIPSGSYSVSSTFVQNVTGTTSGVGGAVKLTLGTTTGLSTNDIVNVTSVGGTTEANDTWVITVNDPTHITLNGSTWANAWTAGGVVTNAALRVKNCWGIKIYGSGKFSTGISSTTTGGIVLQWDGVGYSRIDDLALGATADGIAFDLNWSGIGASTQSNTITNMIFGAGTGTQGVGLQIGENGSQSSETTIINCAFFGKDNLNTGLKVGNANATQTQVFAGNFQNFFRGIFVRSGTCQIIHGVGFQQNTDADIYVDHNSQGDCYSIAGCRSEGSANFARLHAGCGVNISGCTHAASGGFFAWCEDGTPGVYTIDSCYSPGEIQSNGKIFIRGSAGFTNSSFINNASFTGTLLSVDIPIGTVSALTTAYPAAARFNGLRAVVTDANSTTLGAALVGLGSNVVPVYCDGTGTPTWRVG